MWKRANDDKRSDVIARMHPEAFKKELLENARVVRSYLRSLTRDLSDADDLLHDTIEKALRNYTSFEDGTNMEAWLITIAKNIFYNYRKSHAVSRTESVGENQALLEVPIGDSQFQSVHASQVLSFLDGRNEREKTIAWMWAEGCSYIEIGNAIGISRENVGVILCKLRKELYAHFGG